MRQRTKRELSAGGVVYRKREKVEFVIGKHSGYHKWVLPKGLIEKGEGPARAAVREVEEEVGVKAKITDLAPIKTIEYWYQADPDESGRTTRRIKKYQEEGGKKVRVHKRVIYYLMKLREELPSCGWEMSERKWVSYEQAKKMLAFSSEREVLEEAYRFVSAPAGT